MRNILTRLCLLVCLLSLGMDARARKAAESPVQVECHGKLRHGIVSVGGETTGTTITFHKNKSWELQLPDTATKKYADEHNKEDVSVVGTLRKVIGTEKKTRWIVDVKTLKVRDSKAIPDGVDATIQGTIKSTKPDVGYVPKLSIEAGEMAWPIDFSTSEAQLRPQAETLVGKAVTLGGSLQLPTGKNAAAVPPIQIKTLAPVE